MYSVKGKSQAGKIWVKDRQHKKANATGYSARELKNLCILPENSAVGLRSRREHYWSCIASIFENTPKNLVVQGRP